MTVTERNARYRELRADMIEAKRDRERAHEDLEEIRDQEVEARERLGSALERIADISEEMDEILEDIVPVDSLCTCHQAAGDTIGCPKHFYRSGHPRLKPVMPPNHLMKEGEQPRPEDFNTRARARTREEEARRRLRKLAETRDLGAATWKDPDYPSK